MARQAVKMKAVRFSKHGGSDVLMLEDVDEPVPAEGDAIIAVGATSVNRLDLAIRKGTAGVDVPLPHIPGCDAAGTVHALGKGESEFAEGDYVVVNPGISCGRCSACMRGRESMCDSFTILGEHIDGAYAQYVRVPVRNLKKAPSRFPLIKAAAAPLVYITAWHALVTRGRIEFGEEVLITGGSGGVSTAAIQIAKLFNCRVAATTRSPGKTETLKKVGADEVIVTEREGWGKELVRQRGRGFDMVLDSVGSAIWRDAFRTLEKGGRYINYGRTSGGEIGTDLAYVFWKQLSILGSTMGDRSDFETVMDLVFARRLDPVVDSVFSLRQAARAHDYMENGSHVGKVVLEVGE